MTTAVASLDYLLRQPNALLGEADAPKPCDQLYVPLFYLRHLARAPRDEYVQSASGRQTLLRNFTQMLQQLDHDPKQPFVGPNGLHVHFFAPSDPVTQNDIGMDDANQQAVKAAELLKGSHPDIPILTYDPGLQTLAALSGIRATEPDFAPPYSGRRTVCLSDDAIARLEESGLRPVTLTTWQQRIDPATPLFRPNEFIEISNPPPVRVSGVAETDTSSDPNPVADEKAPDSFPAFRRFDGTTNTIITLQYQTFSHTKCAEITPRTAGQRFLLEALLAPADEIPIVIVQGEFGTGKTFLSIAAAYDGVITKRYNSVVVCPRDSRLGDDIGALPGDSEEKTRTKALGFTDNLYQVIKIVEKIPVTAKAHSTAKSKMEEFIRESVEFVPLVEMGGRTLSERFIIYDEVQDMSPSQARAIITRLGDRSKMVIMGDLSQINNPKLSRTHNGLRYLLDRLAGKSAGVAVINLESNEIVRHPLLREIASFL